MNANYFPSGKFPESDSEAIHLIDARSKDTDWLGRFGEQVWQNILENSGWHYIPLARIEVGGAPMMGNAREPTILPDIDGNYDGRNIFVEAKAKTQSIFYGKIGKERHGIDERHYRNYRRIEAIRRQHCAIAIVELYQEPKRFAPLEWSGSLLIEKLDALGQAEPSDYPENPPKVYWNRKQFRELDYGLSPLALLKIASRRSRPSYRDRLENILWPQKQVELFS